MDEKDDLEFIRLTFLMNLVTSRADMCILGHKRIYNQNLGRGREGKKNCFNIDKITFAFQVKVGPIL